MAQVKELSADMAPAGERTFTTGRFLARHQGVLGERTFTVLPDQYTERTFTAARPDLPAEGVSSERTFSVLIDQYSERTFTGAARRGADGGVSGFSCRHLAWTAQGGATPLPCPCLSVPAQSVGMGVRP